MVKLFLALIFYLLFFLCYIFSFNVISLSDYKKYKHTLQQNKNKLSSKINSYISSLCKYKCNYYYSNGKYFIRPVCLADICGSGKLSSFMSFKESIDKVWPFIKGFDKVYDLNSINFYYLSAKPIFSYKYDLRDFISTGMVDNLLLSILERGNYYIKIPEIFLAFNQVKNYSFYVSNKNLKKRNKSRLNNFNIAMSRLDRYILNPGEELNFNKLIAYLPGYKKKNPKSNLMFYGGVCGVSTMLFRNALINPFLYVKERYNHSQRYVYFYSHYIWGDDAAVYELIKKLIIKNISSFSIYFKKKQLGKELYFVSIVPTKTNDFVWVEKYQIGKLKAYIKSIVFDEFGQKKYVQSWISKYSKKNYEK